ncbi:MAG TPA: AbrB/MazE/SpoVT family DNA-binding domain-containing protein [Tepidiformaceae bacterium]|nr:AbrB/MazE/SpoVT family DNA-binding domain-containing protein [Tepidiformaceae bacterium]
MAGAEVRAITRIGKGGRLVIPAEARKRLDLREGEKVMVEVRDGELRVYSVREGIRRAQEIVARYVPAGVSLVDELLRERREEAAHE